MKLPTYTSFVIGLSFHLDIMDFFVYFKTIWKMFFFSFALHGMNGRILRFQKTDRFPPLSLETIREVELERPLADPKRIRSHSIQNAKVQSLLLM